MEPAVEGVVLGSLSLAVVSTNVVAIASLLSGPREPVDYYVLSLAAADLLAGLLVLPLSVEPALMSRWPHGELPCRLAAFLALVLWTASAYTYMWLAVDRYLAARKPARYEALQSGTRCRCCLLFTWLTAGSVWWPPLVGLPRAHFYAAGRVCLPELGRVLPYSATLALLVLSPALLTVAYAYAYIFVSPLPDPSGDEPSGDPDHRLAFALTLVFWGCWVPWLCLRAWEAAAGRTVAGPAPHFALFWTGVSSCLWKPLLYLALSPRLRMGFRVLCLSVCCCCGGPTAHRGTLPEARIV